MSKGQLDNGKYEVTDETLKKAHKPYDIVTDKNNNVGFIQEVSVNECQPEPDQISYAVNWLIGNNSKYAWFYHEELESHCNLLIKIALLSCHPSGQGRHFVEKLFRNL